MRLSLLLKKWRHHHEMSIRRRLRASVFLRATTLESREGKAMGGETTDHLMRRAMEPEFPC